MSGVQVPPPLPKNFNEIDQIYQSHLIYGEIRMRFNTLICQSACDREFADDHGKRGVKPYQVGSSPSSYAHLFRG